MIEILVPVWLYYGIWLLLIVGLLAIAVVIYLVWSLRKIDFRLNW